VTDGLKRVVVTGMAGITGLGDQWDQIEVLRFPRFFVCQKEDFMRPVFADAAL
jgi:hypothetical protein